MANMDAAPPNTKAGGNDDSLRAKGNDSIDSPGNPHYQDNIVDMNEYTTNTPRWKRFYQHSLTQMMLLSIQAFCGPAMADAIAGS